MDVIALSIILFFIAFIVFIIWFGRKASNVNTNVKKKMTKEEKMMNKIRRAH